MIKRALDEGKEKEQAEEKNAYAERKRFKLNDVFISIYTTKLDRLKKELILRGNELVFKVGRRLNDDDMFMLCDWVRHHPEVTAIDLSYNNFTNEGLFILTQLLQDTQQITRLNLMCNDISYEGMKNLAVMGQKLNLVSLRVNGNKIGSEGGKYLAMFLEQNTYIHHLDMAESDQTASGLAYILRVLQYANNGLQFLDISRPIFQHRVQEEDSLYIAECIADTLEFNSALKELVVQKMNFVDSDLEPMLRGLRKNKTLLLLDLSCNQLGDDALTLLAEYLFTKPPLRVLLLGHNKLRDIGLESLSRAFQRSHIQVLDLAANQFTDSGIEFFLNTIKKPFPIKAIYLWGNNIGKKSTRILRRMLYSGVLVQDSLDVLIYKVDGKLCIAKNPMDRRKHIYYCVGDYGFPPPVRIKAPCPDVIPTQQIHQRKLPFKPRIEKRTESGVCPQAFTNILDVNKIHINDECEEDLKVKHETSSDKESESLDPLQMEKFIDRMNRPPSYMMAERLEDERRLRKVSSVLQETSIKEPGDSEGCIRYTDDIVTAEVKEEIALNKPVSTQTSIEFKGTPRFSLPYVPYIPPYPIGMVSILEEEGKLPPEKNFVEEVKSAYVRKFQLPDEAAEEEEDLSSDVNYKINPEPFIISREKKLEPTAQVEEEDEKVSISEHVSSYASLKSEIGETISKYLVLEKNIHGTEPTAPLSSNYEESLQATIDNLRRDSERSLFEVIEDCNRVNALKGNIHAWQLFGQEIVSWAINKALEEIEIPRKKMDTQSFGDTMENIFEGTAAVSDALERAVIKVFEEIAARDSLEKQALEIAMEKAVSNIRSYVEIMKQEME